MSSATVEKKAKLLVPDVMQSTRIVGGEAAKRGEFRGQVSRSICTERKRKTKLFDFCNFYFQGVSAKSFSIARLRRYID